MTHDELIQRGAKWLKNSGMGFYRFPLVITELRTVANEIPDIMGFNNACTVVIECKASLSDFKADLKKAHRQHVFKLGQMRCYLCPAGLIATNLVPEGWGLLYAHPNKITIEVKPPWHSDLEIRWEEYKILYSIVRRALARGYMPDILKPTPQELVVRKAGEQNRFVPPPWLNGVNLNNRSV